MRSIRSILAVATAAIAVLATTPASAQALPAPMVPGPDKVTINVASVNGSGCRPGTAAVAVSPDNTAFTVTFSEYLAQVGVGAKPTDFRRNCQLNLEIHVPGGFTYAIAQADYRGFQSLAKGAYAEQQANYYFAGTSPTAKITHPIVADPLNPDWHNVDQVDYAALVWHPCGLIRNININTELRVYKGTSDPKKTTSFVTFDSADGSISTKYHFAFKKCPDAPGA